ncbi:MAG TPA: hypothetical protein ENK58_07325 [Desulfobacterales bacterium]|nr:MAG: hypothetical protein DRI57_00930 [Deltaproteobacteria bacterium]HHC25204.1 hypothetical protein [Desulfobacterales bacterium]
MNSENDKWRRLAKRIEAELTELEKVTGRIRDGWERFRQTGDDFYTDSTALNMHGFYSGTERVFQLIARAVDGSVPQGANWHRMLLDQMICEVPGVRPAVRIRLSNCWRTTGVSVMLSGMSIPTILIRTK